MARIYLASSWKNIHQPSVLQILRNEGHEVYDFRKPNEGDDGFSWREIDENWQSWNAQEYRSNLTHIAAERGFDLDFEAMKWADTCVLLLPCGKSAHLEAGYFVGAGKPMHILLQDFDTPELMYKMANTINLNTDELFESIEAWES